MKNIIFIFLSFIFIFSCATNNESKSLNIKKAQLAHSKFSSIKNDLSYDDYKLLIIKYGKFKGYPDIKK